MRLAIALVCACTIPFAAELDAQQRPAESLQSAALVAASLPRVDSVGTAPLRARLAFDPVDAPVTLNFNAESAQGERRPSLASHLIYGALAGVAAGAAIGLVADRVTGADDFVPGWFAGAVLGLPAGALGGLIVYRHRTTSSASDQR